MPGYVKNSWEIRVQTNEPDTLIELLTICLLPKTTQVKPNIQLGLYLSHSSSEFSLFSTENLELILGNFFIYN